MPGAPFAETRAEVEAAEADALRAKTAPSAGAAASARTDACAVGACRRGLRPHPVPLGLRSGARPRAGRGGAATGRVWLTLSMRVRVAAPTLGPKRHQSRPTRNHP